MRRSSLRLHPAVVSLAALAGLGALMPRAPLAAQDRPPAGFSVVEATIPDMQAAMREGRVSARGLVEQSLARIAIYEERLNAVLAVNARALADADALDRERAAGRVRGPLHGIPIALKDNIHTTGMPTTGGAIAFEGFVPPYEATITRQLREAGAVIVAKTVLTELANWVASGMPGNYSALAGFAMNPYDPRRDPRDKPGDGRPILNTGGSSSGIGTAASFWAANVGTETSGSILSPANQTMLVGIKPTVGRISRYGIIPITADQDTAGPMARTVTDAAILLGVLESERDPHDAATGRCPAPAGRDYTPHLKRDGLKGARIGIPRAFFYDRVKGPGDNEPRGGLDQARAAFMVDAIDLLRREGAVIVDPADVPSVVEADPARSFLAWSTCAGSGQARGKDEGCSVVFKYGMKRDFNAWLATLGLAAPVKTLAELRAFNQAHAARDAIRFGQAQLDISDEMDVERDRARYEADRARDLLVAGTHGLEEIVARERLDALLFPGSSGAAIAAKPGFPTVIVPFALVPYAPPAAGGSGTPPLPYPAGRQPGPVPFGVSFTGTACQEPRLVELAYAFEQASRRRVPPPGF